VEVIDKGVLIKKGAEADIYLGYYFGFKSIFKIRIPKSYRDPRFDQYIRRRRTILEARALRSAHEIGIPTPTVLDVDVENTTLIIEYLDGPTLKELLTQDTSSSIHFNIIGEYIGKLHSHGMYHGDLTTSNIIVSSDGRPYLIDFGLSGYSMDIEDYAIDIHLMLRTLESTHFNILDEAYRLFVKGYTNIVGSNMMNKVLRRVKEIRARGRYVEERVKV